MQPIAKDANIEFLIQNIVLPPKLPQKEPDDLSEQNFQLLQFVSESVHNWAALGNENSGIELDITRACKTLKWMVSIHNPHKTFKTQLRKAILNLEPGDSFGLHVVRQNAGITFRRVDDSLQFETFEVSPLPEAVVNCKGRLKCTYPGPTTTIPWQIARDTNFLTQLGNFLLHMKTQEFSSETLSKSRKGGNQLSETRSTADPRYIVELFTGMMRGIGTEATPNHITKNIRDEANWNDAAKPWRRSGLWLVIRVVLQTSLRAEAYKCLILEVIRSLLNHAIQCDVKSDEVSYISKKLARRCQKIDNMAISPKLLKSVGATIEKGSELLKHRWEGLVARSTRKIEWSSDLDSAKSLDENKNISLPRSLSWINERINSFNSSCTASPEVMDPTEKHRFSESKVFPQLESKGSEVEEAISLIDFETWIKENLETWIFDKPDIEIVRILSTKIQEYHKKACGKYKNHNVLDISRMILTILEMWVRLDEAVCKKIPLLLEYSPELPETLLEPLLFIQKLDMMRVTEIERYLTRRNSVTGRRTSIFNSEAKEDSFAARYYTTVESPHSLRWKIVDKATKEREKKIQDLMNDNSRHAKLLVQLSDMSCEFKKDRWGDFKHRARKCSKCKLQKQANNMSIDVHEWPLPENETQARCVLFELQPPEAFAIWRDTTFYIMMDVCWTDNIKNNETAKACGFDQWNNIWEHIDNTCHSSRISWASTAKPISGRSHYKQCKLPAAQSDVIVKHAGRYRLHDNQNTEWVEARHKTCSAKPLCQSVISDNTYRKLSYAVNDVSHTPNEVIARQSECPSLLTLREYDAFAILRSGHKLQWHNIFLELHKCDLSFNKEAVYTLILHAACHLGEASDGNDWRRESHTTLSEREFSVELLQILQISLQVLKDNWEQATALNTLVLLAQRLVSCGHESVQAEAIRFLKSAREVCDPWIKCIQNKVYEAHEETLINDLRTWLLRVAGIQCSTFDIDKHLLSESFQNHMDMVKYLTCQNIIYDNCLGVIRTLPPDLALLLERNRRFSVLAETFLQNVLRGVGRSEIPSEAVRRILPDRDIKGVWTHVKSPATRWWRLRLCPSADDSETTIHFNVLEGKLLVNGKPNGRLPLEYLTHKTYNELLGKRIFDVIPSKDSSMTYETKEPFCGITLHFHLQNGHLAIRKQGSSGIAELVSAKTFEGDIPIPILDNGTQWLDFINKRVVFYQTSEWWNDPSSSTDWILDLSNPRSRKMTRNKDDLLDINGDVQGAIHQVFAPIETKDYIITTSNMNCPLNLELPRYKLEFWINGSKSIECRSLRGWAIDPEQSIGCLVGLRSFLKFRLNTSYPAKECILVPYGNIKASMKDQHCSVEILPALANRSYTIYQIDHTLNRLTDDGTLKARYMRLYLHALCSGILPDYLTGRTGVDEALDGLRSAASFSFQTLTEEEAQFLNQIAKLTPNRDFYPSHLKVMQQIKWEPSLPIWVQNDKFCVLVEKIFSDWASRQFLVEGSTRYEPLLFGSLDLLSRARYHNSVFDQGDTEANNRISHSITHTLRHLPGDKERDVYDIASASFRWRKLNHVEVDLQRYFADVKALLGPQPDFVVNYAADVYDSDPVTDWCGLYDWCRNSTKKDRFAMLFTFSVWLYKGSGEISFLKSLITIAASGEFQDVEIPSHEEFEPSIGLYPERSFVENRLGCCAVGFENSQYSPLPCEALPKQASESNRGYYERRESYYRQKLAKEVDRAADEIMKQREASSPANPIGSYSLLRLSAAMDDIRPRFDTCYRNRALAKYFHHVEQRLKTFQLTTNKLNYFDVTTMFQTEMGQQRPPSKKISWLLRDLLLQRSPGDVISLQDLNVHSTTEFSASLQGQMTAKPKYNGDCVRPTIEKLTCSTQQFAKTYADDLSQSVKALEESEPPKSLNNIDNLSKQILEYNKTTTTCLNSLLEELQHNLSPRTDLEKLLEASGLWPTSTKLDILQMLQLKNRGSISQQWLEAIVCFGKAITWLQRSNRLCRFLLENSIQEIEKEMLSFGHRNCSADKYTDWLLFEIDSEMLIRPVQAEIGLDMMTDEDNGNAVMQLNMGEGKSAVIIPIVAAALADTTKLVRPIVLKPLSTQMFQILVHRLSGLCDRRIYLLPFHRGLDLNSLDIDRIRQLHENCKSNGDILLSLPEYLLSFKLMGLEKLLRGNKPLSDRLLEIQSWLDKHTRDVLDESDEILHIRYQLIYTMGQQETLEGDQDRWNTIQDFLGYLSEKAVSWAESNPAAIEVLKSGRARYPTIRIVDKAKGKAMLTEMAEEICLGNSNKMRKISSKMRLLSGELREQVFEFISVRDIALELQESVLEKCENLKTQLLVLRGLIAQGVLLFILRDKRYRVDYGLDTKRSNLAVPYRAKDRPAVKAEFGHPEVVLTLTCLTYYYGGLEESNLERCFELLFKTDDPNLTYENWTVWAKTHEDIPDSLSRLQGLNLRDEHQLRNQIYPFFKYNKNVIDFFLSEFIFPREAKGFPHKLSTSGWDIAERKTHNTTGFSGTNDNRYLLPTSIKQLDLPQQLHTNSLVLMNILQEDNDTVVKAHIDNRRLTANEMLQKIVEMNPKIHVLLDVGAQILELTNCQVASEWLKIDKSENILGALFFGEDDELLVMGRDEKIEKFMSSNLSKQLDRVLVYLDEAHTRGTDLKLPVNTRAAVTLGPNLTKDKFVQGCMRMRKLGNGHSLVFFASPDIYSQIQKKTGKSAVQAIHAADVLLWTMQESCRQIQHGFGIWQNQGFQYLKRKQGWGSFRANGDENTLRNATVEIETLKLVEMYGIGGSDFKIDARAQNSSDGLVIMKRLEEFSAIASNNIKVQEEQEREVDHEVEEEANIERPQPAKPKLHWPTEDLIDLVRTGKFKEKTSMIKNSFAIFAETSYRSLLEDQAWNAQSRQLVTRDFAETVERLPRDHMDDYLRPVRWVVEFKKKGQNYLLFISPFEANELMPDFKVSRFVRLHCYAPRVSRGMQTFEHLCVCSVRPTSKASIKRTLDINSRIRLNLFAGQLFFEDQEYYKELCNHLGLNYGEMNGLMGRENDGWVPTKTIRGDKIVPFSRSPIPFLNAITKMRRKGQGFASTHLGGLLDSRVLGSDDFV